MPKYDGEHEDAIRPFVDAMRVKLASNRHKGRWENITTAKAIELLKQEVVELEESIAGGNTVEMLLEAADVANMAMIIANIAIGQANRGDGSQFVTKHSNGHDESKIALGNGVTLIL